MKRRALVSVSDKRGSRSSRGGSRRWGSRSSRPAAPRGRSRKPGRGRPRLRGDGRPRDTRRPGKDAAPQDPRRHPRRPRRPRPRGAARRADIGPIDLVCINLYPFEETVAGGRLREGGHRADRHRRPRDAARRGQELQVRDGRPLARVLQRDHCRSSKARARSPKRPAAAWRSRRSGGPPSTTRRSRPGSAIGSKENRTFRQWGRGLPEIRTVGTNGSRRCVTGRTRTRRRRTTRRWVRSICSPAWRSCRGGRSPSTTSTTSTPPVPSSPT